MRNSEISLHMLKYRDLKQAGVFFFRKNDFARRIFCAQNIEIGDEIFIRNEENQSEFKIAREERERKISGEVSIATLFSREDSNC